MYDFSKYKNATPRQIENALSLVEKRAEELALQTKKNKEFSKFLQKKLNSFSAKKTKYKSNIPNDKTIKALNNAKSIGVFNDFDEAKKALMNDN